MFHESQRHKKRHRSSLRDDGTSSKKHKNKRRKKRSQKEGPLSASLVHSSSSHATPHPSEAGELDVDPILQRLANRLKKKDKVPRRKERGMGMVPLSERDRMYIAPIYPPDNVKRTLPKADTVDDTPQSYDPRGAKKSVLRYLMDCMDEGKSFMDILPMKKAENLDDAQFQPEKFPDLDPETERRLNEIYDRDIERLSEVRDFEDEETAERPPSPGAEYDAQFTPAEIGVRRPRFRADIHAQMFENSGGNKNNIRTLLEHAKVVEKGLMDEYNRNTSIETIQKRMVREHVRRKKQLNARPSKRKLIL